MLNEHNFIGWLLTVVSFLVGFLLLDTYLALYGWVVIQLLVWWFGRQSKNQQPLPKWMLIIGCLVIGGLVTNLFTTISLPLSLQTVMKWLVGVQVWWFGWQGARRLEHLSHDNIIKLIWTGILILLASLAVLSLLTWWIPSWRFLPDMNLIYANFGHSHLSVVLVLFFPFVMLADRVWPVQKGVWWWLLAIGGMVAMMIGTFGRVGLMVLTGQLVIMLGWLPKTDWSRRWLSALAEIALVGIAIALIWSSLTSHHPFCPVPTSWQGKLCKSIKTEQRPEYWRQAWLAVRQHPVWGTGLGTFSLVSYQFRKEPGSYSGFVHNDYLQFIVEAGWWGWLVSGGLWVSWWLSRPPGVVEAGDEKKNNLLRWFQWAVWIGIGGVLVNSLFDFDLHFAPILLATLAGLGVLTGLNFPSQSAHVQLGKSFKISQGLLKLSVVITCFWAGGFFLLDHWWSTGAKDLVWQWGLPYQAESLLLARDFSFASSTHQAQFLRWYEAQPRIMENLVTVLLGENVGENTQIQTPQLRQLITHVHQINPWSRLEYDLVAASLKQKNLSQAVADIQDADDFYSGQEKQFGVRLATVSDEVRWRMASQSAQIAALAFEQNEYELGVSQLLRVPRYESWALASQPEYCQSLLTSVKQNTPAKAGLTEYSFRLRQALSRLDQVDPQYFGGCQTELAKVALWQLDNLKIVGNCTADPESCEWWKQAALRWSLNETWVQKNLESM